MRYYACCREMSSAVARRLGQQQGGVVTLIGVQLGGISLGSQQRLLLPSFSGQRQSGAGGTLGVLQVRIGRVLQEVAGWRGRRRPQLS